MTKLFNNRGRARVSCSPFYKRHPPYGNLKLRASLSTGFYGSGRGDSPGDKGYAEGRGSADLSDHGEGAAATDRDQRGDDVRCGGILADGANGNRATPARTAIQILIQDRCDPSVQFVLSDFFC